MSRREAKAPSARTLPAQSKTARGLTLVGKLGRTFGPASVEKRQRAAALLTQAQWSRNRGGNEHNVHCP